MICVMSAVPLRGIRMALPGPVMKLEPSFTQCEVSEETWMCEDEKVPGAQNLDE